MTSSPDSGAPNGANATSGANALTALLGTEASRPWWRRPAPWITAAALLAAGAGYAVWQSQQRAAAAPSYTTHVVARGTLALNVTANGTLQPTRAINIGSELSGTVLKVHVDVNDRVRKGQVLVELDTAKLQGQVLRSKASLASAQAKLAQAQVNAKEAQLSLARLEEVARLSGGKVPSKSELDAARAVVERSQAEQASAKASIADARAALATDEINLSKASIRAPADGVVLTRNVDPGNAVAASLQAVTLFSIAEDLNRLRLQVYVDEADVGMVKAGQQARFTVSAHPGRQFPATLTRVAYGSTLSENVVTYLTQLDVDNSDLSLRPGMTATATITAQQGDKVLLVPNAALRFTPTNGAAGPAAPGASKSGSIVSSLMPRPPVQQTRKSARDAAGSTQARQVWVLGKDGTATPLPVQTGLSDGRMTEITGGELREGMAVITDQKVGAP